MSTENKLQKASSLAVATIDDVTRVSKMFYDSGMFNDLKSIAQAGVKIMAGSELGITPFQSISGVHIISGKPVIGAGLMASMVDRHPEYDFEVLEQNDKVCSIQFYKNGKKRGVSTFTAEDARKADTKNMNKFPANMLYARAMSNGVKWYCPGVFAGPVYVPEEFDNAVQQTEDTTYTEVKEEDQKPAPTAELQPEEIPDAEEVEEETEQGISDDQAEQILELLKHPAQTEATVKKVTGSLYTLTFQQAADTVKVLQKKISAHEKAAKADA